MTEIEQTPPKVASDGSTIPPPRQQGGSFSLAHGLLLIAVIGVWSAWWIKTKENQRLKARVKTMSVMARELFVPDPSLLSAVQHEPKWVNHLEWELYVPPGTFELCLSTHGLESYYRWPVNPTKTARLKPGRHVVELIQSSSNIGHHVGLLVDGAELIGIDEPSEWKPKISQGGGSTFGIYRLTSNRDDPLSLFHNVFVQADEDNKGTGGSTQTDRGVAVWIRMIK